VFAYAGLPQNLKDLKGFTLSSLGFKDEGSGFRLQVLRMRV